MGLEDITGSGNKEDNRDGRKACIVVVLPARNEAKRIGDVLKGISGCLFGDIFYIIVVDDASEDATASVAKKLGASVFTLEKNMGVGYATRFGLQKALDYNADIVVMMDSDGQHDPSYIHSFVSAIKEGTDVALGCRYLKEYPFLEKFGNRVVTFLCNLICGSGIRDVECGYRAVSADVLRKIMPDLCADDYGICSEFAYIVWKHKLRVANIPILSSYAGRKSGKVVRGINDFLYVVHRRFGI